MVQVENDIGPNDGDLDDEDKPSDKRVTIVIELSAECEDWEVDNIRESIEQSDGVRHIDSFKVEGFPERRWGQ